MGWKNASTSALAVLGVLMVAVLFSQCAGGVYRTPVNRDPLMNREQVILKGFSNAVSVSAVRAKSVRMPAGQLHVRVQLIKEALGSDFVEIMTAFVDSEGFETEKTNWEPVHLEEGVMTQYETSSLSSKAVDFRVVIRNPPG